jgi:hypothetical protein
VHEQLNSNRRSRAFLPQKSGFLHHNVILLLIGGPEINGSVAGVVQTFQNRQPGQQQNPADFGQRTVITPGDFEQAGFQLPGNSEIDHMVAFERDLFRHGASSVLSV